MAEHEQALRVSRWSDEPVVFVIDEDPNATNAVRRLTDLMQLRCQAFASGRNFLKTFNRSQWGCVVTELTVADLGGFGILKRLTEEGSTLPVIIVTGRATIPLAVRAMREGAFHFLEKPFHDQELWDTLQDAITTDHERRHAAERQAAIQERLALLTRKEEQVVRMMAEGKPNRVIAEALGLSLRTIEVRRRTAMTKLGFEAPDELLAFAVSLGNGHTAPRPTSSFAERNASKQPRWPEPHLARAARANV